MTKCANCSKDVYYKPWETIGLCMDCWRKNDHDYFPDAPKTCGKNCGCK